MKISFYKIISIAAFAIFMLYWITIPLLTLPHIPHQTNMASHLKKPVQWLVFNWRFFARPGTFNQRVYLINQQANSLHTDTLELITPIVMEKQNMAPFNQRANILDHFLHYAAASIHRNVIKERTALEKQHPSLPDSFYYKHLPALLNSNRNAKPALTAMERYCKQKIHETFPNASHQQFKYVITAQNLPAFGSNENTLSKEVMIYDSGFLN